MTILELEQRSGLSRASVRFYEAEGFISPARRENGYRDYSEADLELLLRLKLLRSLGMPLSEIHALQRGELGLAPAMERHMGRLAQEHRELTSSEAVCRGIFRSGEEFAALDAGRWLAELEAGISPPQEDAEPKLICPWRRYFARTLDFILCEQLLLTPIMLIFRPNVDLSGFGVSVALIVGTMALMLLLEPLCLHLFGTTPGKALLGLHVERPDGGRLGLGEAARRTFDVLTYGLGFYVPILSQVMLIKSWLRHKNGRPLRWEEGSELRLRRRRLGLLTAGYILLAGLALFTLFVNQELSQMPKNRGGITAAEFCENYNSLAYAEGYLRSYISLTPEGWERTSMNPTRLEVQGYEAEYSFYEAGGALERLELRLERSPGRVGLDIPEQELKLALMSGVWGSEGCGLLDYYERRLMLSKAELYGSEGFSFELPDTAVDCKCSYGVDEDGGVTLDVALTIDYI